MSRGYDRPLYILPFDHRSSFENKMFGWHSPLSDPQTAEIAGAKRVVYDGLLAALSGGVPREKAGIPVDQQYGAAILRDVSSKSARSPGAIANLWMCSSANTQADLPSFHRA